MEKSFSILSIQDCMERSLLDQFTILIIAHSYLTKNFFLAVSTMRRNLAGVYRQ